MASMKPSESVHGVYVRNAVDNRISGDCRDITWITTGTTTHCIISGYSAPDAIMLNMGYMRWAVQVDPTVRRKPCQSPHQRREGMRNKLGRKPLPKLIMKLRRRRNRRKERDGKNDY